MRYARRYTRSGPTRDTIKEKEQRSWDFKDYQVNDDRQYQFPTMEALEKAQKYVHVFAKRHSPRWRFQTRILPALRLWVQRFE